MFAAQSRAISGSISIASPGRLNPVVRAISCTPEPAAASRITPAGRTVASICSARALAIDHGVERRPSVSVM
uniref:Uncharacterized protein n=1 Tax=uncultured marine microorganism HF4000_ANIW141C7 TaxID=455536 RepID=B3T5B4_9ZZZZ|nr:hypothetical protein ALOHA_HF4000ANIW141C7ctg1g7 [uncultured marine microorganism HF4000_ANIW141C7]